MTFKTVLLTYIVGGLTFLPIVFIAILIPAWRLLPVVNDVKSTGVREQGTDGEKRRDLPQRTLSETEEAGASGTFAVLRKYDLPAALAALNSRNSAASSAGTAGTDHHGEASSESQSVYQSMYRSVFDRHKGATSNTSLLENQEASSDTTTVKFGKKSTPVSFFYIVLRHGHLMLYDSSAEREVRHVISLAHYTISLSAGPGEPDEQDMKDGELFIKRTAIVLTPTSGKDSLWSQGQLQQSAQSKPFYLFSTTCIDNEDFYHALLSARDPHPIPQPLDTDAVIKLQSVLHSTSSLTPETRAINALVSRIFLALHHTDSLKALFRDKIEKKISRVQKPAFIASLAVQSIDLGDAAPILSNPRLRDLNINGDLTIAFDIKYTGGIKFTFAALAKLDLGPRFKTRTADLLLSTSLQRLQGHMLIRIKPSPSNRLWFCFESIPEMDIKVEPVVSQRQITYTFILRAIEDRIRGVVGETLVQPNWDDVPFLDTRGQAWRGGIWTQESEEQVASESPSSDLPSSDLRRRHQKTMSMPALGSTVADAESSGASSGSDTIQKTSTLSLAKEGLSDLKRRSVNSLHLPATPDRDTHSSSPSKLQPSRTPTLTTPSATAPSVQLDENHANFDPSRGDEAHNSRQQQRKWRILPSVPQQGTRRDAIESIRAMRDRNTAEEDAEDGQDGVESGGNGELTAEPSEMDGWEGRRSLDSSASSLADRTLRTARRSETNASASSSSTTRSQRQQEAVQKGKTLFAATAAATTAATTAAKNWGWTTLANRKGQQSVQGQQQRPLGRGQPLPPPGMPLPGPQKGWLPSGTGSVKRKPVLPPRKDTAETHVDADSLYSEDSRAEANQQSHLSVDDGNSQDADNITPGSEFGPWTENSGVSQGNETEEALHDCKGSVESSRAEPQPLQAHGPKESEQTASEKKVPPPLPARRDKDPEKSDPSSLESIEPAGDVHTGSGSATSILSDNPTSRERPADVVDDMNTSSERMSGTDKPVEPTDLHMSDDDDLVAIPAPADDHADEAQLKAEGVQQDNAEGFSKSDDSQNNVAEPIQRDLSTAEDDGEYRYGSRNDLESDATYT